MSKRPTDKAVVAGLPSGSFEAVQGIVSGFNNAMEAARGARGPELRRSLREDYLLQQVASQCILDILQDMEIEGSADLAAELRQKTAEEPLTDLVTVELASRNRLDSLDEKVQTAGQHHYVRLASEVGATARATVAVCAGGGITAAAQASLERARLEVEASDDSAAREALSEMLAKLADPPLKLIESTVPVGPVDSSDTAR